MQLYAITDRRLFAGLEALIEQASLWGAGGVDFVQIREKDFGNRDRAALAGRIVHAARFAGSRTRILLNGPAEIAAEAGCDGVHLPSGLPAEAISDAKAAFPGAIVSVSCHTATDIEQARDYGATLALFAPVFEKHADEETLPGQGLHALAAACRVAGQMPVFALGGITLGNARSCMDAGAIGIAAIRLFASGDWVKLRLSR